MKNILILAEGAIARKFLEWVNNARVAENSYHVICAKENLFTEKMSRSIPICHIDPTSYSRLLGVMGDTKFSMIFIVMDSMDDAKNSLQNIRHIDNKVRVVLLDRWGASFGGDSNLTVIDEQNLLATHLYEHLPNVPVVAQNIGLGEGEIMEILVPFGSSYSYRHVGSVAQRKWKIAAIYRDKKQILPTSATMIYPNDTLLVLGKPRVLEGVYKSVNRRLGLFPEPFGKHLYLILDLENDKEQALLYLQESIYLTNQLQNKRLIVRVIHPTSFSLLDEIKQYSGHNISIHVSYSNNIRADFLEYDIQNFDIGMVLNSSATFEKYGLATRLFILKKVVYVFGVKPLYDISQSIILMTNISEMESISSTAIEFSESLNLKLQLCNFDPEGNFKTKADIVEHYETLSQIFNFDVEIVHEVANPIRKLQSMKNIILIAPFNEKSIKKSLIGFVSTRVQDYLLTLNRHPSIFVPVEIAENI